MTHYFFDSSALVKRYISERGTPWIRSLLPPNTANVILIANVTQVEIMSGILRRMREKQISQRTAQAIRVLVDHHASREYTVIGMSPAIIEYAENILEKHPLRAYDSIQLASALEANTQLLATGLQPLVFVSADNRLLTAASLEGLQTDDPNLHP
jgi:predicted nucleic acid-binding protein